MLMAPFAREWFTAAVVVWMAMDGAQAQTQDIAPINSGANPYRVIRDWALLTLEKRPWGGSNGVAIDKDGRTVWATDRCSPGIAPGCLGTKSNPIHHFDESGKEIRSFGGGMFVWPHGIHVDRDGNVWVTDARAASPEELKKYPGEDNKGSVVVKFSPEGKVLLTIGVAGGATGPNQCCWQPNDVITNEKGEIFISEGHGANPNDRILVYSPDGKTILRQFGKRGTGPGEFNQPHALAFDGQGRLFVGDRGNNRVQIFDQSGKFIADWPQFSRPSGLFIDRNGMLYSADSESGSVNPAHGAWKRGLRWGSVKDGKIIGFIPDPSGEGVTFSEKDGKPVLARADGSAGPTGTLAAEGVAVDAAGNIYGAEVGPRKVQKYIRKK
jgi:DNA-binding beta-propeller fold protein YncE